MVTLYTILLTNIAKTSANNKKDKALKNLHKNLISINFIIPGDGRHGARLAKKLRETFNTGLGLIILYNFALSKTVPYRGTFTHITRVTPQIIKNITSGQARLAALLEGIHRKLKRESLQTPQTNLGENIKTP